MRRAFRKEEIPYTGGNYNQGDDQHQLARSHVSRDVRRAPAPTMTANHEENKAQNLMPERMDGLYSGGKNVLDKLPGLPRQMLLRHDFIVSKGMTCTRAHSPVQSREYLLSEAATEPMAL